MNPTTTSGNRAQKRGFDYSLDNAAWDYPPATQSGMQYLILSSPRTGSTMLASALIEARDAGVPIEYFHNRILEGLGAPLSLEKVMNHFETVRRRRTTPNGVFGMKLHGGQFRALFMRPQVTPDGISFLRKFSHALVITRRDKIAQAMSYMRSVNTGVWNSAFESDRGTARYAFAEEDVPELCRLAGGFKADELLLNTICSAMKLNVFHTTYEELSSDPSGVMRRAYGFLGLPYAGQLPATQRLAEDDYASQKAMFLKSLGAI